MHKDTAGAFYDLGADDINVPPKRCFFGVAGEGATAVYYSTFFHELARYAGFQIMPISVSTEPEAVASGSTEAAGIRGRLQIDPLPSFGISRTTAHVSPWRTTGIVGS